MKKSALVIIGSLVFASQVSANDLLNYHLATAGDRNAPTTHVVEAVPTEPMNVQDIHLSSAGDKSMPASHNIKSALNDEHPTSLFEYHYNTAN